MSYYQFTFIFLPLFFFIGIAQFGILHPLLSTEDHNKEDFDAQSLHRVLEDYMFTTKEKKHTVTQSPSDMFRNAIGLIKNNKYEEGLDLFIRILEKKPLSKIVLYNIAYTLKKIEKFSEAITLLEYIVKKNPGYAKAQFCLSLSYLTVGNFKEGWKKYEWRWKAYNEEPKQCNCPVWDGSDIRGKKILLYAEQGFGDTLQYIRYAQVLKNKGAIIIVQTQNVLFSLLLQCPYIDMVIKRSDPIPPVDTNAALMSLPFLCKTDLKTIPHTTPYLHACPKLSSYWKQKLASDDRFKIGICWQGNAQYQTAALRKVVTEKSIPLRLFESVSNIPGTTLYSLQKTDGLQQLDEIKQMFAIHLFNNLDEKHGRFMDTAAIIKHLDLIITVDTSIAHLAGGLGVPVWLLLPKPADWRWMLEHLDSPWYPTMKIFRQTERGNWNDVIKEVVSSLHNTLSIHNF